MRKRITLPAVSPAFDEPPTEEFEDLPTNSTNTGIGRPIEALKLHRKTIASRLMGTGAGRERVIEALTTNDATLSYSAARNLYYEILGEWEKDYKAEAPYYRASQIRRLQSDLATMRAERAAVNLPKGRVRATWNDIRGHERELAKITGTLAPVNVRLLDVNETMRESLAAVISEMTPDEMKDIIGEGVEVEEAAEEAAE